MAILPAAACSLRSMNWYVVIELLVWLLICCVLIELPCRYWTNKKENAALVTTSWLAWHLRQKGSFVQLWSYNAHPYLSLVILKIAGFKTNILYNRRFFLSRCFRRASLACVGWVNATHSLPQCFCFRAGCIALLCNQFEKNVYNITKVEPAFWLVKNLWFNVPMNS